MTHISSPAPGLRSSHTFASLVNFQMPTIVLRPFLRLLSPPSSRPTPPSVFSTRCLVFQRFQSPRSAVLGISIQSSYPWDESRSSSTCRQRRCCAVGVHTCCDAHEKSTKCCAEGEDELSAEEDCEGLEKWNKGGGVVHKLAQVDPSVVIETGAVIHSHAIVGANTRISSGSVVGSHVVVGAHTRLGFNVALQNCSVGDFCILHSGVCVGQDGFGFTVNNMGEVVKKPQTLKVRIGNNVEIGANSCIDRGSWRDTVIGDHTKIDNLVQIGHNVVIGRCCMLCGQVGLAGSSTLGDYVVMGGKSGVADHVSVTSKVRIAAKSAVTSNIVKPGDYAGFPAVPAKEWRRAVVNFRKLGRQPVEVTNDTTEI